MRDASFEMPTRLPLLPLRDVVVFPGITLPLFVGRTRSVDAVKAALAEGSFLVAVAQRRAEQTEPTGRDLYRVGSIVAIREHTELPDGTMRLVVTAIARVRTRRVLTAKGYLEARLGPLPDEEPDGDGGIVAAREEALRLFEEYVDLRDRLPAEVFEAAFGLEDPAILSYFVAGHLAAGVATRQRLLEVPGWLPRLQELTELLAAEIATLRVERKNRRSLFERSEPRGPRIEPDPIADEEDELEEIRRQVAGTEVPDVVRAKANREIGRLSRMNPMSPEATVSRTYLDWIISLPWVHRSEDTLDLEVASRILDEDHYGLQKVKDRILEHISVLACSRSVRGPVLCLVGPPGVGKTSLGRSIGRALGREFVRMSLGGVRDESEIRGHRRTYIGSMPGRVIQGMRRAGTVNPLFLLDEIDKMGFDYRGDPAAALLEVLDPEQNNTFQDHYLDVDYDLSNVLFITTANGVSGIAPPLLDRMELLELPGYLEHEKVAIARRHLLPRQIELCGLTRADLSVPEDTLVSIVRDRTREAGVRNLEREIAGICRKAARRKADPKAQGPLVVEPGMLPELLGAPRFRTREIVSDDRVGVATGLAWTEVGGVILNVEVALLPGRGTLILTGKLGETMQESTKAALSYIRARSGIFGLERDFSERMDVHVHLHEGGVPKDGPSAGITLALAMVSALTGVPTRVDVALTGEITLRGTVLPVGGLGQKLMAARRSGIQTVLVPEENLPQVEELPTELTGLLRIVPVRSMDEVIEHGLDGSLAPTEPSFAFTNAH